MKEFLFRRGRIQDADAAEAIYTEARQLLRRDGIDQWQHDGPDRNAFLSDVYKGQSFVLLREGIIVALAAVIRGPDPTYLQIENGAWHSEEKYTVIHRVAASPDWRGKGAAGILFSAITEMAKDRPYLRIDTHEDNCRMQRFLEKQGFDRCGRIYLENGDPRIAFDRLPNDVKKDPNLSFSDTGNGFISIVWEE